MLTLWIVTCLRIGNINGAMKNVFFYIFMFAFVWLYLSEIFCFRFHPFMVALNGYVILLYYLFIHSLIQWPYSRRYKYYNACCYMLFKIFSFWIVYIAFTKADFDWRITFSKNCLRVNYHLIDGQHYIWNYEASILNIQWNMWNYSLFVRCR